MKLSINILYFFSLVLWVGGIFFFSFLAAPSIFKVLSREFAGNVVADIFPKYHLLAYICGTTALTCTVIRKYLFESHLRFENLNIILLVMMLGFSLYSSEVISPRVSEVKTEIRNIEPASQNYQILENKFKNLHIYSVIINLLVFLFGIAIIIITAYNYRV